VAPIASSQPARGPARGGRSQRTSAAAPVAPRSAPDGDEKDIEATFNRLAAQADNGSLVQKYTFANLRGAMKRGGALRGTFDEDDAAGRHAVLRPDEVQDAQVQAAVLQPLIAASGMSVRGYAEANDLELDERLIRMLEAAGGRAITKPRAAPMAERPDRTIDHGAALDASALRRSMADEVPLQGDGNVAAVIMRNLAKARNEAKAGGMRVPQLTARQKAAAITWARHKNHPTAGPAAVALIETEAA
jgi:hypothetical protein